MKKRTLVISITSGLLLLGLMGSAAKPTSSQTESIQPTATTSKVAPVESEVKNEVKAKPATCNGTDVTSNCAVGDVTYKTYVYHEAVPEKTRQETTTTYKDEISGYCTLCNDGTYSPSCATGRGACSHHGGVAEWNAPRYRKVPVESTRTVVEAPAKEAYYEKVVQE